MNYQLITIVALIMAIVALTLVALVLNRRLIDMRERKDGAYLERNRIVALLASIYPSGTAITAIPGWDAEWHNCVYIELPTTGQVSWHFHDEHRHLFHRLPAYLKAWDGHDTEEKYSRVDWQVLYNLKAKRRAETHQ